MRILEYKQITSKINTIHTQDIINERLQKPNEDVHDFIDVYLAKIQAEKDVPDSNFERKKSIKCFWASIYELEIVMSSAKWICKKMLLDQ